MNTFQQRRRKLLEEMESIERMQRGTLTEQFYRFEKDGKEELRGPYYVLQRTQDGRHYGRRVSQKDLERVREDVEGYERFERLAEEFACVTQAATLDEESKKNSRKSERRSLRRRRSSSR